MSVKKTDPELLRDDGPVKFIGNKESRFQPDLTKRRNHYSKIKHLRFGPSAQSKFLQSFDTQIMPTQLPPLYSDIKSKVQVGYLISEIGLYLLTEDGKKLKQEE